MGSTLYNLYLYKRLPLDMPNDPIGFLRTREECLAKVMVEAIWHFELVKGIGSPASSLSDATESTQPQTIAATKRGALRACSGIGGGVGLYGSSLAFSEDSHGSEEESLAGSSSGMRWAMAIRMESLRRDSSRQEVEAWQRDSLWARSSAISSPLFDPSMDLLVDMSASSMGGSEGMSDAST